MRKFILAFTALVGLSGGLAIANNYLMTQGAGTSFGSLLITGVNYVQMMVCDATTPSQCSAVSAAGAQKVDGSAVTQPVSQGTASALNATVVGTGTFATQSSLTQGGSALSATNGIFTNLLLGNAVLSATNGLFTNVLQGNAVLSLTNPSFASITDGTTKAPVKAASTAAVATDAALVVAVSPNNTILVKVASGQIASGAVASGAIASGAYASGSIGAGAVAAGAYVSGSVLSGAYASGSLASGAVVDLTNLSAPVAPNTATATKSLLIGGQFNTTQETLTNGQQGQVALSARGAIMVATGADTFSITCSNCSGSGASAVDAATFTAGTSVFAPAGGEFTTGGATACVTGHQCLSAMTASRGLFTDVNTWAETSLGAPSAYGTSPGAVNVIGVNAFVTNTNANGQATAANSSPVVLPAAQVTADPCTLGTKTNVAIATSSGTVQLVAPSGSTQVYVCSIVTVGATASVQNLVGGTGATCTTGTPVAAIGSTTAASGMSFAANGGFTYGGGAGTVARTTTAGHGLCLIQSGTAAIAGNITYVQL